MHTTILIFDKLTALDAIGPYRPRADAGQRIEELAAARDISIRFLEPGEWVDAAEVAASPAAFESLQTNDQGGTG